MRCSQIILLHAITLHVADKATFPLNLPLLWIFSHISHIITRKITHRGFSLRPLNRNAFVPERKTNKIIYKMKWIQLLNAILFTFIVYPFALNSNIIEQYRNKMKRKEKRIFKCEYRRLVRGDLMTKCHKASPTYSIHYLAPKVSDTIIFI